MDEDTDFLALEDEDDDLIELAPAPKRFKRLKPENTKKSASAPDKAARKRAKDVHTDEKVGKERAKRTSKATRGEKSKPIEKPAPKAMELDDAEHGASHEDVDFEDVQWEDVDGEGEAEEAQKVLNSSSGALVAEKHEFDIHMAVDEDNKGEEGQKNANNPKKRKRESTGPKKRRGSKKERDDALNYHNMHLLCWIGHAIHMRKQCEANPLLQALLVSLLPLPLFEEITSAVSTSKRVPEAVCNLLAWFHNYFYIVEPLTAPNRTHVAPPTIDLTLEDDDDTSSPKKAKKRHNTNKTGPASSENEAYKGPVHHRLGSFLFSATTRPIVISQQLAFRVFTALLEALQIPYRSVWYLDKLVVPSKFSDLSLIRPKTPFSLHHWTNMIAKALNLTFGEHVNVEVGAKLSKQKDLVDPAFMWVELFSSDEDRWISLDVFRKQLDMAQYWNVPVVEGETPKKTRVKFGATDCAYIIGVGRGGKLTHVSPRYVQSCSEPMMKVGDAEWFVSFLSDWNSQVSEWMSSSTSPPENANHVALEKRMEKRERKEMESIAAAEGFPKTLDAYKAHPLYVLERHLLKFEVLRPNHSASIHKVGDNDVYLRKDVSLIHTPDKWIQNGMQVKVGEQPVSKMIKRTQVNWDNAKKTWVDESEAEMSEYFGDWQIEPFVPGVAQNGIVPKNRYGNVYLFKPTMLPIGCVHLQGYPHLDKSARKVGVDVAPAMVGWTVEGYWSTPELDGWVLCKENMDVAIDAWHADTAKREADLFNKIRARAAQHWLNLTKQLLLKTRMDSVHGAIETPDTTRLKAADAGTNARAPLAPSNDASTSNLPSKRKEQQHTHTFPEDLSSRDESGNVTRRCPCGYTDSVQRL